MSAQLLLDFERQLVARRSAVEDELVREFAAASPELFAAIERVIEQRARVGVGGVKKKLPSSRRDFRGIRATPIRPVLDALLGGKSERWISPSTAAEVLRTAGVLATNAKWIGGLLAAHEASPPPGYELGYRRNKRLRQWFVRRLPAQGDADDATCFQKNTETKPQTTKAKPFADRVTL